MKTIKIIIFFFAFGSLSFPNGGADSTKAGESDSLGKAPKQNVEQSLNSNKKKRDLFVDKDGDGICDHRANGLSFEKHRKRYQFNKDGKGRQRGKK